jgi:hypothetical protein
MNRPSTQDSGRIPWGVAIADREKSEKTNKAHSVARFQKLLIEKCFAQSAIYPFKKELRAAEAAKQVQI